MKTTDTPVEPLSAEQQFKKWYASSGFNHRYCAECAWRAAIEFAKHYGAAQAQTFEEWAKSQGLPLRPHPVPTAMIPEAKYGDYATESAWKAWREAGVAQRIASQPSIVQALREKFAEIDGAAQMYSLSPAADRHKCLCLDQRWLGALEMLRVAEVLEASASAQTEKEKK